MNATSLMTRKSIQLPKGGTLEVEATPQFIEIVKKHFKLQSNFEVSDDHIRMYVWGAFKNAVDKAERGM
ncbi:MAG: hypothetical protein FJZ60_00250 [Chlamydiae bacterium]|nr:hypothetical protein [Chlamydiota bacterium]